MSKKREFRYDPLYRIIDAPEELRILEGSFSSLFNRLKRIGNLGIIPDVFEMAKYPKYEHGLGTIHQVSSLLDVADEEIIPQKYTTPLKIASIFLHLGHLPYTYSTERAFLLASNLGDRSQMNRVQEHIRKKIAKVFDVASFDSDRKENILKEMLSMRNYRHLYKYFSASILVENWNKIEKKIKGLDEGDLQIIVRDLVDPNNAGYGHLELADKADFVQRDALYFGTIKIDIAPKHLYAQLSKKGRYLSVSEEKLIDYNLNYLTERFYENPEVIWFSRLYEKILASLIISSNFKLEWLYDYNDQEFRRLVCDNFDNQNNRIQLPANWNGRAKALFEGEINFKRVVKLIDVYFSKEKDAIDIEYELIGKRESQRGLLIYPFENGILLSVDYDSNDRYFSLPGFEPFSVTVFQDESNKQILELLGIAKRLSKYLSISHSEELREGIGRELSWTNSVRFDNYAIVQEIAEAITSIENTKERNFISKFLQAISKITKFNQLWVNFENEFLWKTPIKKFVSESLELRLRENFVRGLLGLPVRLLQYSSPKKYLNDIYEELLERLSLELDQDKKGNIFEAIWLIDRLRDKRGKFQLFLNGMIVVDPEKPKNKQDDNEFDVIELLINDDGKAECWVYACSIADNYISKNEEQLRRLLDYLHKSFPDLAIRTWYVIPENKGTGKWGPKKEDTGRNVLLD